MSLVMTHERARDLRYQCSRGYVTKGAGYCKSVTGRAVDAVVERLLLDALRPSAIAVSLALAEQVEIDRAQRRRHRALKLEQAAYAVDLTGILDRARCEATAWSRPWVAGRPDPDS